MIQVEELFIEPTATVLETLRKLDVTGQRILFIAPEGKLKAVITDGDIRKFFLRGGTPDQTVDHAANYHPLSVPIAERGRAREILQKNCIDALPKRRFQRSRKCHKCKDNRHIGNTPAGNLRKKDTQGSTGCRHSQMPEFWQIT